MQSAVLTCKVVRRPSPSLISGTLNPKMLWVEGLRPLADSTDKMGLHVLDGVYYGILTKRGKRRERTLGNDVLKYSGLYTQSWNGKLGQVTAAAAASELGIRKEAFGKLSSGTVGLRVLSCRTLCSSRTQHLH